MTIEIVLVYPSLLGVYGDRGNAKVLLQRLRWRGYDAKLTIVEATQSLPDSGDIYILGGAEDASLSTAVKALHVDGGLNRAADRGAVVFAVCAGFQILGTSFTLGERDDVIRGLGVLDVATTRGPVRAVGELLSRWIGRDGEESCLTGFENHGGYTTLGPNAAPLARVEVGIGNAGDGTEGAVAGTVLGTYAHGPVLARNPALADHLLQLALCDETELAPLIIPEHDELRRQRLAASRNRR